MIFESGTLRLGFNYWESKHATDMWRRWDPETIERDFATMAAYGTEWVRCFPFWPDFQPIRFMRTPGNGIMEVRFADGRKLPDTEAGRAGLDEEMLRRFEYFCRIAEKHKIKLIVCLLTGQMTFGLFVPPALEGMDLYADPRALKWEGRFVQAFVGRMKQQAAIGAWESGNESAVLGPVASAETPAFWMNYIHTFIRQADPDRPVVGINDPALSETAVGWHIRDIADVSDALTVHPYPMFDRAHLDEYNEIRNVLDAVIRNQIIGDVGGKASFIEETGVRRATAVDAESQAAAMRNILWNAWAGDSRAFLWWCAFDQSHLEIAPYDWPQPTLELGLFHADRTPYPAAEVMRDFGDFLKKLPFRRLPEPTTDAVCISTDPEIAKTAGILALMNGAKLKFQTPYREMAEAPLYLLPSIRGRGDLSTGAWNDLKKRIHDGATLYLSLQDCFLADLEEVCGAVIAGACEECDEARCGFADFELKLPRPVRRRMKSRGAEVLASDQYGDPVFFRHRYGKGTVYTCALEVEEIISSRAGMYRSDGWKLYRLLFAGKKRLLHAPIPHLLATDHYFAEDHALTILRNCSAQAAETVCEQDPAWEVRSVRSDRAEVRLDGKKLYLPGNCGAVIELIRKP